jgi:antitoxin PrlF
VTPSIDDTTVRLFDMVMRSHYHVRSHHIFPESVMASLEIESTLTDRYQTTVPDAVRRTLKLRKRDKIRYVVRPDGAVLLTRAEAGEEIDPVVGKFLAFLARDMEVHPAQVRGINAALLRRARALVKGVKVDLDAPLQPEDE